ncbi:MAG: type II toxin-antitoxin system VapC family toxin [Mesorhizobium sp.]|nr:type II toxin-antitoxin system VapC family toxin [Mesorhizobium sp.]
MKTSTLIDTNVLIDVLGPEHVPARRWSLAGLKRVFDSGEIILSAIVWAELARPGIREAELEGALTWLRPEREDFPFSAAAVAGMAHARYRRSGGTRERTLPDFLIGAHAATKGHSLLTRDPSRYRTYFPSLEIIAPDTHP